MSPKVSIVVPIYNVEKYLEKCVDSLLGQTLTEIEIILVDDGSPDRCGQIADEYAAIDSRIKVVHQNNSGLGPARNSGIKLALGEYVGFVDSDDWVKPEMFERLYDAAMRTNSDIVVSGHCDLKNGVAVRRTVHPLAGQTISTKEGIMQVRKNLFGHGFYDEKVDAFPMSVCMSLYKRTLFDCGELAFQNILSEDTIFNLSAYKVAKSITFTDNTDYCYRKDCQSSITHSLTEAKVLQCRDFLNLLSGIAEKENDPECVMRAKRTAIDYCRLYGEMIVNSKTSIQKKRTLIKDFCEEKEINRCWDGYPTKYLPLQQRLFHWAFIHQWLVAICAMIKVRLWIKEGKQKLDGYTQ